MSKIEELLERVKNQPHDVDAREVLADALIEAGDPRGELAQVQRALQRGQGAELVQKEAELTDKLKRAIGVSDATRLHFDFGLLNEVFIDALDDGAPRSLAAVCDSPLASTLREVAIVVWENESSSSAISKLLGSLPALKLPKTAKHLRIGEASVIDPGDRVFSYFDYSFSDNLEKVLEVFPNIEALTVDLGMAALAFSPLSSSKLKRFEWRTPYLERSWLEPLARSELPALERFVLYTGMMYLVNTEDELYELGPDEFENFDENYVDVESLQGIFGMLDGCANLREVGIRRFCEGAENLLGGMKSHAFFKRIKTLDIRGARVSDPAALAKATAGTPIERFLHDGATAAADDIAGDFRYVVTQE